MKREEFEQRIGAAASQPFRIELRGGQRISVPRAIKFWIGTHMCHIGIFKRGWLDRTVSIRMEEVERIAPARGSGSQPRRGSRR
ncbi:MAG: hypothetical protein IT449_13580 [Phycisphaerales bacterium]|nr:hypothetical protein [Phycisphaerales bacterium]